MNLYKYGIKYCINYIKLCIKNKKIKNIIKNLAQNIKLRLVCKKILYKLY